MGSTVYELCTVYPETSRVLIGNNTEIDCQSGMRAGYETLAEKTFADGSNTVKFAKVFTCQKFPALQYLNVCRLYYRVHCTCHW